MVRSLLKNAYVAGTVIGACAMALFVIAMLVEGQQRFFSSQDLLASSPDERRRVVHPAGFSVICPQGWNSRIVTAISDTTDERIEIRSRELTSTRRIYGTYFEVRSSPNVRLQGEEDTLKLSDGREIRIRSECETGVFPERPDRTRFELLLTDFPGSIMIICHKRFDSLPSEFLPYVASIRWEKPHHSSESP